jgi:hypothetical protein
MPPARDEIAQAFEDHPGIGRTVGTSSEAHLRNLGTSYRCIGSVMTVIERLVGIHVGAFLAV